MLNLDTDNIPPVNGLFLFQARAIFEQICPGEEFLPKAPNPEDIIWDDGEGTTPEDSGFKQEEEADKAKEAKKEEGGDKEEESKGDASEKGETKEMEEVSNEAKAKGDEAQPGETTKEDKGDADKEPAKGVATTERNENEGKDEQ